jgi:hypothetical protein
LVDLEDFGFFTRLGRFRSLGRFRALIVTCLGTLASFNLRLLVDLPDFDAYVGDGEIDGL